MSATASAYWQVFSNRRMAVLLLLGFASGLPLALTGGTLQAWLASEQVDFKQIGLLTLVGLPYTWKFLWAPLMDRYAVPLLGRRRGWLVLTQVALALGILWLGTYSPRDSAIVIGMIALLVATLSASQDIVFDAYRTDLVSGEERGAAAAVGVLGYRVAMLVSGALALILAETLGFRGVYALMGALMLIGIAATLFAPEPVSQAPAPRSLWEAVRDPLRDFFSRRAAWLLLALIVLYKLGDAFAGSLTTAFLLRGPGFALSEVGAVNKGMGLISTIVGALFAGALLAKWRLWTGLIIFGVLQAISNLAFMWLASAGKSYALMVFAVALENVCGGMGTTAFVALLMALCDKRFSATQYALLSALAATGRIYLGPLAGFLVDPTIWGMGWPQFFFLTFLVALPGLVLLWWMRPEIERLGSPGVQTTPASNR